MGRELGYLYTNRWQSRGSKQTYGKDQQVLTVGNGACLWSRREGLREFRCIDNSLPDENLDYPFGNNHCLFCLHTKTWQSLTWAIHHAQEAET